MQNTQFLIGFLLGSIFIFYWIIIYIYLKKAKEARLEYEKTLDDRSFRKFKEYGDKR